MRALLQLPEMPKSCAECPMGSVLYGYKCLAKNKQFDRYAFTSMQDWCPLIELPPHGRLGDLDKLEQMFADIDHAPYSGFDGEDPFYSAADAAQIIRLAPTIIPAEEDDA